MNQRSSRKCGISIRKIMAINNTIAETIAAYSCDGSSSRAIAQVRNVVIMNSNPVIRAVYPNPCCAVPIPRPSSIEKRLRIMIN